MATTDYTLFESFIGKNEKEDEVMMKLTCDQDIEMRMVSPRRVKVFNGLSMGSPMVVMDFVDGIGDLVNYQKLDTGATYTLYMGTSRYKSIALSLKIAKITFENNTAGKTENFQFTVNFVHESWNALFNSRKNRGWSNAKLSTIVNEIATESGLKIKHVSETAGVFDTVVQPHWNNLTLLQWLKVRSYTNTNTGATGHFEYGIDLKGNFFYIPFSQLYQLQLEVSKSGNTPPSENRFPVPVLRLDGSELNSRQRSESLEDNGYVPATFAAYGVNEDYLASTLQGAGGTTSMHYDYVTGTYQSTTQDISSSTIPQLSEWSLVQSVDETNYYRNYGGRDTNTPNIGNNRMSEVTSSLQEVKIQTEGNSYVMIGDVIEMVIPTQPNAYNQPYNEMYSGYYVISEVEHVFSLGSKASFNTRITLSRQGIDGKEHPNLTRSTVGKINVTNNATGSIT
jgi:hypothetical protein